MSDEERAYNLIHNFVELNGMPESEVDLMLLMGLVAAALREARAEGAAAEPRGGEGADGK